MVTFEEQQKIEDSGIREIFTPGSPAVHGVQFSGRKDELSHVLSALLRKGEHSLIYGDRGVGKTTLANRAATQYKTIKGAKILNHSCSSKDTFIKVLRPLLSLSDIDHEEVSVVQKKQGSGGAEISAGFAKAKIGSQREEERTLDRSVQGMSLSEISDEISNLNSVFIIDEFDTIENNDVIKAVAEFIKILGDKNSLTKLVIVGVAETSADLLRGHKSLGRGLKETKLNRMSDHEIIDIVARGSAKANINFSNLALQTIATISEGFPFFAHLIALHCAEHAIAKGEKSIGQTDLTRSLNTVAKDARATLAQEFNNITLSYKTELYKWILVSCSKYGFVEFNKAQIRNSLSEIKKIDYTESGLAKALSKFCEEKVFVRVKRGYYKFSDPRMPSFIKLEFYDLLENIA